MRDTNGGTSNIATVRLVVGAATNAPQAQDTTAQVQQGNTVTIFLDGLVSDLNDDIDWTSLEVALQAIRGETVVDADQRLISLHSADEF